MNVRRIVEICSRKLNGDGMVPIVRLMLTKVDKWL